MKRFMIVWVLVLAFISGCSKQDMLKTMQDDIELNGIESVRIERHIGPTVLEREVNAEDIPELVDALDEFEVEKISKNKMEVMYGGMIALTINLKSGTTYEFNNVGNYYLMVNNENYVIKNNSFKPFDSWVDAVLKR
ncbi:hypothetical protein PT129_08365 [Erysipelothrix rhusiopathiae]|uniref:hypothetical protein n=1 Tax=Erysipelothrix rhusiopathiae TaxID=1648 RepID=UPI000210B57F|nr:hypothetical protein [Erysipelothrix rhusiopathiae]AGN23905.1 hypothetical protein K210_01340 [Erysipelothrix rhusiopathiae SY1027]AMS11298.1 hypothetical protein A2I91_05970 [Erysipelothrix rhusiopathiae]AOO67796.1 hypothetical protein BC346_05490 [Erysipelothrix rhusiopathiae]AWU41346.1 hypothetical protein DM789_03615 [Erysipelothrix rhusiopathiae]AYV34774.1 hypothetical protein EEY85_05480 [Erysipelothrix rhusiopathiae]